MKIAATYENGNVFGHFGHTEYFKVYDIEDNKVVSSVVIGNDGLGHGALAGLLNNNKIDVLICGGMGMGAKIALSEMGIKVCAGVTGSADKAVEAYLNGTLVYSEDANCDHHNHEHACGEHSCGGRCH